MKSNLEMLRVMCNNMTEDMTARFLEVMMTEQKKQILEKHPHKIYMTSGGRWRTQIDEKTAGGKRKVIEAVSREKLEDKLFQYYLEQSEKESWTIKREADESGKMVPVVSDDFSIEAFYWEFRRTHDESCNNSTHYTWDTNYKRFFEDEAFMKCDIRTLTYDDVHEFVIQKIKTLHLCSDAASRLIQQLKKSFNTAVKKKVIQYNPIVSLTVKEFSAIITESKRSPQNRRQVLDDSEFSTLKTELEKSKERDCMTAYALEFAILTGCRVGEIAGLNWEDIFLDCIHIRHTIKCDRTKKGSMFYFRSRVKSKRSLRDLPVTPEIAALLEKVAEITGHPKSGPVFRVEKDGEIIPIPNHRLSNYLSHKTELPAFGQTFHAHSLRKTFNSHMERAGVPASLRAVLLGHDVAINLKHYTHNTADDELALAAMSAGSK